MIAGLPTAPMVVKPRVSYRANTRRSRGYHFDKGANRTAKRDKIQTQTERQKEMTTYAVGFVNEDGELEIIPFNKHGRLESYIAQSTLGRWEELAYNEIFVTKVIADAKHHEVGDAYTHQGIMRFKVEEDVYSFHFFEDFEDKDWLKMYVMASEASRDVA
jgi:hypothetical protein